MPIKYILLIVWAGVLPVLVYAQVTDRGQPTVSLANIRGTIPAAAAHIVKFYVDERSPNAQYETGNLHVIYSDNTEVIETLRPKEKGTANNIIENQEGIVDPRVAQDQRSIAWTETVDNAGTSYSIPLVLAIYQSGKSVLHIQNGQMVWYWAFLNGGKHIAAVWGATHGPEVGNYQLYDAKTGRLLSEIYGDSKTQTLSPSAPEWAKQVERQMHSRK